MKILYNKPGIANLYCDNGGEYLSNEFQSFMRSEGTDYETTVVGTPQLGGVSERAHRTIMERSRALLFDSGLPLTFWNFAALTAVHIINRSPSSALPGNVTPFKMLTGLKPDFSNFQVFGCVAYAKTLGKLDLKSHSDKCIFLGYLPNGYKLMRVFDCRLINARSVEFDSKMFKDLSLEERSLKGLSSFMSSFKLSDLLNSPIPRGTSKVSSTSEVTQCPNSSLDLSGVYADPTPGSSSNSRITYPASSVMPNPLSVTTKTQILSITRIHAPRKLL